MKFICVAERVGDDRSSSKNSPRRSPFTTNRSDELSRVSCVSTTDLSRTSRCNIPTFTTKATKLTLKRFVKVSHGRTMVCICFAMARTSERPIQSSSGPPRNIHHTVLSRCGLSSRSLELVATTQLDNPTEEVMMVADRGLRWRGHPATGPYYIIERDAGQHKWKWSLGLYRVEQDDSWLVFITSSHKFKENPNHRCSSNLYFANVSC